MAYIFRSPSRGPALVLSLCALSAYGQQAPSGEESARPGVNDRFLSSELNAAQSASGFESDTREVYLRRTDVVAALDLAPGMTVADVGAGSGFYVELMAAAVGATGRVFAVEIAPNWIEFLERKVEAEDLTQVSVVLGTETSVELPADSVDLIFSSDTYHHFEYPQTSLASIYRALRSGGRWVVLDYDKIEGVTPPRRMDHLRIGKTEAIEEILAAGFTLEAEPDLGFTENYLAIFRRP